MGSKNTLRWGGGRNWVKRNRKKPPGSKWARNRTLMIEPLEDRQLLSAVDHVTPAYRS